MDAADESRATHVHELSSTAAPISRWWRRGYRARWVSLGLVAGLVVGAGGFAVAAIPDAGTGVFHGCVNRATGLLRVIDPAASGPTSHCVAGGGPFGETPITWNQTGPQGLPGTPGAPGAKGDKGDKGDPGTPGSAGGLPAAFTTVGTPGVAIGTGTSLASLNLPPGRYLVTGRVNLEVNSPTLPDGTFTQGSAFCGVAPGFSDYAVVSETDRTPATVTSGVLTLPITLETVISLGVPTTLDVQCTNTGFLAPVVALRSSIIALAVAP